MKNKRGFTLIELLAVIVILGILMLIAIPSVTKYIDSSKKEAYVKTINSMVEVVRYGIVSETSKYSMNGKTTEVFYLTDIELEKGSNKSPYGDFAREYSYVVVTKEANGYKYEIQAKDDGDYCIEFINMDELDKSKVKKCDGVEIMRASIYEAYSVGDQVTFLGTNWYVIKDSSKSEDYVTLMKEFVLTNSELGDYAYNGTYNTMEYTWSDTCHNESHGYTSADYSDCNNTNDYDNSKVKEMLENSYISSLGSSNLKEVNGYKIRLITLDEIRNYLGLVNGSKFLAEGNNVPTWVYKNFGEKNNGVYYYWTMSPYGDEQNYLVSYAEEITCFSIANTSMGVRPVINLLKSSIN